MAHSRFSRCHRRSPLLHADTRATAVEIALIAAPICIIALAALHLVGINLDKIIDAVIAYL
jgi:Flp pilus assembly pilin Flp